MIPKEEPSVVGKTSWNIENAHILYIYLRLQEEGDPEVIQTCRILVTTAMITARRPVTARQPVALVVHRFCGHFSSGSSLPWDDKIFESFSAVS